MSTLKAPTHPPTHRPVVYNKCTVVQALKWHCIYSLPDEYSRPSTTRSCPSENEEVCVIHDGAQTRHECGKYRMKTKIPHLPIKGFMEDRRRGGNFCHRLYMHLDTRVGDENKIRAHIFVLLIDWLSRGTGYHKGSRKWALYHLLTSEAL